MEGGRVVGYRYTGNCKEEETIKVSVSGVDKAPRFRGAGLLPSGKNTKIFL
jgi:hypothetical protein